MALATETPSRLWRRIEEGDARGYDMPSLPSLPGFEETVDDDGTNPPSKSLSMNLDYSLPTTRPDAIAARSVKAGQPVPVRTIDRLTTVSPRPRFGATRPIDVLDKAPDDEPPILFGAMGRSGGSDRRRVSTSSSLRTSTPQSKGLATSGRGRGALEDSFLRKLDATGRSPSPILPPRPNETLDIECSAFDLHKTRDTPEASRSFGKSHSFKDVAGRNLPDAKHPPELSRSVSSLSSSDSSRNRASHGPSDAEETIHGPPALHQPVTDSQPDSRREGSSEDQQGYTSSYSQEKETMGTAISSHEPTFSSEVADSMQVTPIPVQRSVRFSSLTSTPAAAATPRPMHHYHYQQTPRTTLEPVTGEDEVTQALATPFPRRKSFLLSIVNSTTRPRLTQGTPHPRSTNAFDSSVITTPRSAFPPQSTFGRTRLSHPLSQVHTFKNSSPYTDSTTENDESSPEGAGAASVISTASSHDLTVHHRANASFDPITGPQGVGRFNAGKLNTYLHGLNRRLQEENELLVDRVKSQQAEIDYLQARTQHLSGVIEDDRAEEWGLEKESLERRIMTLQHQLDDREKDIDDERQSRMQDKERWKDRMAEVEDGVGQIVAELQEKLAAAETKALTHEDTEMRLREAEREIEYMQGQLRIAKARDQSDSSKSDGNSSSSSRNSRDFVEMEEKILRLERVLKDTETDLAAAREKAIDAGKDATLVKTTNRSLESDLRLARESIENLEEELRDNRRDRSDDNDRLRKTQEMSAKLKSELSLANDKAQNYEKLLADIELQFESCQKRLDHANEQVVLADDELEKLRSSNKDLEKALEESDEKMLADSKELTQLRAKVAHFERELEGNRTNNKTQADAKSIHDADIENLEGELEEANKEIGRLNALVNQSPARKAIEKAKESRIEILEKENADLFNQLRAVRENTLRHEPPKFDTPRSLRSVSMSNLSPMHRQLINLSLRAPKTPGEPLRNASWLFNMTGDITSAHLMEELHRLQRELDIANESIDDKLDKLGEAGLDVVELTKALEEARRRIGKLEVLVAEYEDYGPRRDDVCLKCEDRDARGDALEPSFSVQMRLTLVTAELDSLRKRHEQAIATTTGEKAVLRDAASRLNSEIRRAKEELRIAQKKGQSAEKSKAELEKELQSARRSISDLESDLHIERAKLHALNSESATAIRSKEKVLERLRETERRMDETKDRLFQLKESNIRLEAQLRVERQAPAPHLEEKLLDNSRTIENLRQERESLADMHFELQQHLGEASKHASDLAMRYNNLQMSHDGRRRKLDMQSKEIEDLRAAIMNRANKVQPVQAVAREDGPKGDAQKLATRLESELKRISREAEGFGRDLIELREERSYLIEKHQHELEHYEHVGRQNKAQLQLLHDQLSSLRDSALHEAEVTIDSAVEALKAKHNKECKGLFVQIRYLKAKFTREAALRDGLSYQKGYLLVLLQQHEKSEKRILAAIAQIDPSIAPAVKPARKTLRSVVHAVLFIQRTKQACDEWRQEKQARLSVIEAVESVRRGRELSS